MLHVPCTYIEYMCFMIDAYLPLNGTVYQGRAAEHRQVWLRFSHFQGAHKKEDGVNDLLPQTWKLWANQNVKKKWAKYVYKVCPSMLTFSYLSPKIQDSIIKEIPWSSQGHHSGQFTYLTLFLVRLIELVQNKFGKLWPCYANPNTANATYKSF